MKNYRKRLNKYMGYCDYYQPWVSDESHTLHKDQGNTATAAPFLIEKKRSRLGCNAVQIWSWPCTDKSSSLVLGSFYYMHISNVGRETIFFSMCEKAG